jgi:hypothetical protein
MKKESYWIKYSRREGKRKYECKRTHHTTPHHAWFRSSKEANES